MLALAGMAVANVVLPSPGQAALPRPGGPGHRDLHDRAVHRPHRGAVADRADRRDAFGDWRDGLGVWAVIAVVAAVPWLGPGLPRPPPRAARAHHRVRRRAAHPAGAGDGAVLRVPVAAGLRDLRLVRDAAGATQGFSATDAGPAGRAARRHRHPPVALGADPAGEVDATRAALLFAIMACYLVGYAGHAGRAALAGDRLGGRHRRRHHDVPADPHPRRAARPHARGHGRAVQRHPVGRLPDRGDRPVHVRGRARRHRRLDLAARAAARDQRCRCSRWARTSPGRSPSRTSSGDESLPQRAELLVAHPAGAQVRLARRRTRSSRWSSTSSMNSRRRRLVAAPELPLLLVLDGRQVLLGERRQALAGDGVVGGDRLARRRRPRPAPARRRGRCGPCPPRSAPARRPARRRPSTRARPRTGRAARPASRGRGRPSWSRCP